MQTANITKLKSKIASLAAVVTLAVSGGGIATIALSGVAQAAAPNATQGSVTQFTPDVVNGMTVDRSAPSGGYSSTNFGGRSNVLEMNIDSSKRSTVDPFYYTEGLQQALTSATSAKADVYIPSSWLNGTKVRAGMWGVGNDSDGNILAYPIVEFTTSGDNGYVGWRTFNDDAGGWVNLPKIPYNTNGWNTVGFALNPTTTKFDFTINGKPAGSSFSTGSTNLSGLIFNSYNYGPDNANYSVHWSNLVTGPGKPVVADKDTCKDGGWSTLTMNNGATFKNQGDCVSYFASNKH